MMLGKITLKDAEFLRDNSGDDVLHVEEPHALVMAAGYLKFKLAQSAREGVYFRGQRKLYGSLAPSLYRGLKTSKTQGKRHHVLSRVISRFRETERIFSSFGDYAHEALLQHYGFNTSWIDLVDNVWVALWFACFTAKCADSAGRYVHYEQRRPSDCEKHAYLLLVAADITPPSRHRPGCFYGANTELVDLRMAAPSIFLRPHAQHGLLFRKKGVDGGRSFDYSDQIRGIIRVDLQKALDWLGSGRMLNANSLFPPPFYDNGYRILLNSGIGGDEAVGVISHVGV